jgi:hypothetical protein
VRRASVEAGRDRHRQLGSLEVVGTTERSFRERPPAGGAPEPRNATAASQIVAPSWLAAEARLVSAGVLGAVTKRTEPGRKAPLNFERLNGPTHSRQWKHTSCRVEVTEKRRNGHPQTKVRCPGCPRRPRHAPNMLGTTMYDALLQGGIR